MQKIPSERGRLSCDRDSTERPPLEGPYAHDGAILASPGRAHGAGRRKCMSRYPGGGGRSHPIGGRKPPRLAASSSKAIDSKLPSILWNSLQSCGRRADLSAGVCRHHRLRPTLQIAKVGEGSDGRKVGGRKQTIGCRVDVKTDGASVPYA
jgi:hypothetical protein